jgi:predicted alpha/beta superfamily hydrolase
MNKFIASFVLFLCCKWHATNAQLTIVIDSVPRFFTPILDTLYVAGTFNNWDPGHQAFKMQKHANGTYTATVTNTGALQFKFTRGAWANNETLSNGNQLPNRTYTYNGGLDTIHCSIANWSDYAPGTHTATQNVHVLTTNFYMPQLSRWRRVWIYLPNDYYTTNKYYPVVYMHDGQNVFDAQTSFAGEWCVDDTLRNMQMAGDSGAIVVAIDNGGQYRLDEYCPYNNPSYGGGQGDAYADFLINTLKPYIDTNYRVYTDRMHTAIAGSSVGAYIALYTGLKHQQVFSKIGSFSPAYWFDDSIYTFVLNTAITQPIRIYQVCSQNEGASVVYNMNRMRDSLTTAGLPTSNVQTVVRTYGSHSESFWRLEYGIAHRWLFSSNAVTQLQDLKEDKNIILFPNPVRTQLQITYNLGNEVLDTIRIFDENGQEAWVDSGTLKFENNKISFGTKYMRNGLYNIWLIDKKDHLHVRKFIKQ